MGTGPLYIEPGSPWENGYGESFNGTMRDQRLNGELFATLKEAQPIIERWRIHDNTVRPHSSLGGQPPAPETPNPEIEIPPCSLGRLSTWVVTRSSLSSRERSAVTL